MTPYYSDSLDITRENIYLGKLRKLWPVPIGEFMCTLPNISNIQKTIKKLAYQQREKSTKDIETSLTTQIKKNLYETNFNFIKSAIEDEDINNMNEFNNWIKLCIKDYYDIYFKKVKNDSEIKIKESWVHITNNKGYHGPHVHPNCTVCGNFYVDIGQSNIKEMNGVNTFFSPISTDLAIEGYDYYGNGETVVPQNFKLTLFPPNLLHNATPYSGKDDRIILAFNAIFGGAVIDNS